MCDELPGAQLAEEGSSGGGLSGSEAADNTEDTSGGTSLFAALPLPSRPALAAAWSRGGLPAWAALFRSSAADFAKYAKPGRAVTAAPGYGGHGGQPMPFFSMKPGIIAH